jgi:hypothetical protein
MRKGLVTDIEDHTSVHQTLNNRLIEINPILEVSRLTKFGMGLALKNQR